MPKHKTKKTTKWIKNRKNNVEKYINTTTSWRLIREPKNVLTRLRQSLATKSSDNFRTPLINKKMNFFQ